MKLLGRNKGDDDNRPDGDDTPEAAPSVTEASSPDSKQTAPKGRPTPKRDAGRKRGPIAPAPMTSAEARARRKELRGPKLSRADRKIERAERRAEMDSRRVRMMAGEEAYLLPRDQGPVRRYVRDIVDSRRSLLGLFMPMALVMIVVMLGLPLQMQQYVSTSMLLLMVFMAFDALLLARKVNNLVDVKFPNHTEKRWKLGLYAAGRASQLRRMRAPRPQVERGAKVD